jgi:hypothetical protein
MIARLPGSGPGQVKRTARVPVSEAERVQGREGLEVPRHLVPAPMQVRALTVFALLVSGVLLPIVTLALARS